MLEYIYQLISKLNYALNNFTNSRIYYRR